MSLCILRPTSTNVVAGVRIMGALLFGVYIQAPELETSMWGSEPCGFVLWARRWWGRTMWVLLGTFAGGPQALCIYATNTSPKGPSA